MRIAVSFYQVVVMTGSDIFNPAVTNANNFHCWIGFGRNLPRKPLLDELTDQGSL